MANFATNANGAIWWQILQLMQVAPSGGHASSAKIATNASCITCWPNWEPKLVLSPVVGTTYNWPNLEPMQVAFFFAGEITQVKESIPWVRCASGNVSYLNSALERQPLAHLCHSCHKWRCCTFFKLVNFFHTSNITIHHPKYQMIHLI